MTTNTTHTGTDSPTNTTEGTVTSADGTSIAWTRLGSGPDLVMVHCVGVSRATTMQPTLPAALAEHFTVWTYDRRGKGRSGNTQPYAVEREYEDLAAILELTDGPVTVYGFSSGATLSLLAAAAGLPIDRLALLEPPLYAEPDPEQQMLTAGRSKLADGPRALHQWFQTDVVGVPEEVLSQLPPLSTEDLSNAPTLLHELAFLPGTGPERFAGVAQPTALIASDSTVPEIHQWGRQLAEAMPDARTMILPGEWHGVDDATLTAGIVEFAKS